MEFAVDPLYMDCCHYITDLPERKSGQHLQREERGAIQALKRQGLSNRAIARELGCSPTTIGNELRRVIEWHFANTDESNNTATPTPTPTHTACW